jgi:hypothetical protein
MHVSLFFIAALSSCIAAPILKCKAKANTQEPSSGSLTSTDQSQANPAPGTTFFLTKTKYPTWKQIDQALLTFQPFWKPKIMFAFEDKKLKRVKGMDGLVEGFAEYDVGKVPGGFFV